MKTILQKWVFLVPVVGSLIFSGCNSVGSNDKQPTMSLSFMAKNSGQAAKSKTTGTMQNNHVTITEAKILVREVEFESDIENDGIAEDSLNFEAGPFVVSLKLDGSLNKVAVNEVKPGSYDEIEFDVHKPEDNETPPDPEFKIGDSGDERFSIIVKGTYNGENFVFRSRENMEQEIELSSPLVISEDTESINTTLTVDLSQWFVDANGNLLNPTNPDNQSAIDESIERSFEDAFEDSDEDGAEDVD